MGDGTWWDASDGGDATRDSGSDGCRGREAAWAGLGVFAAIGGAVGGGTELAKEDGVALDDAAVIEAAVGAGV